MAASQDVRGAATSLSRWQLITCHLPLRASYLRPHSVIDAFASVPREWFVGPGQEACCW